MLIGLILLLMVLGTIVIWQDYRRQNSMRQAFIDAFWEWRTVPDIGGYHEMPLAMYDELLAVVEAAATKQSNIRLHLTAGQIRVVKTLYLMVIAAMIFLAIGGR